MIAEKISNEVRLAHYIDVVNMEMALYGAHDIPKEMRVLMGKELAKGSECASLDEVTSGFKAELEARYRGCFD